MQDVAGARAAQSMPMGEAAEGVMMQLTVKHGTRFYFTVDADGNVHGEGEITYDLSPNLCGVAALTRQVNEQVNLMSWLPSIYKAASEIGTRAVVHFNADWYEEEAKLAKTMEEFGKAGRALGNKGPLGLTPQNAAEERLMLQGLYRQAGASDDVMRIVRTIIYNRCVTGNYRLAGDLSCTLIGAPASAGEGGSVNEAVLAGAAELALHGLLEIAKEKFKALDLEEQREEAVCEQGASGALGTKVGPSTKKELAKDTATNLAEAILQGRAGIPATGLLLSVPGVTQVQYYYKGLANGAEPRLFKIKGHLEATSGGPRLYLEMDGDVQDGDKQLWLEYMVNYKTEKHPFPTWSPFLAGPAAVQPDGTERTYERKTVTTQMEFVDLASEKKQTVEVPSDTTVPKDVHLYTPFATFRETGTHRNGLKFWYDYEYYWNAHKVTEPAK
ncbi:MAG TPA: hypothetical protein VI488_19980 [Candidatus Angelobacter sp.]